MQADGGYFGDDYLSSTRAGSTLVLKDHRSKDVRIITPTGARLGTIEMQIGAQQPWAPLEQVSSKQRPLAVVYQRFFGRAFSGTVSLRVVRASNARPAQVDADLLR